MTAPVAERLQALRDFDEHPVGAGRSLDVDVLLQVGDEEHIVHIERGRVASIEPRPFVVSSWAFALRASAEDWERLWSSPPVPGSHDLFAMVRHGTIRIEGDLHPFMANLLYFKALLRAPGSIGAP